MKNSPATRAHLSGAVKSGRGPTPFAACPSKTLADDIEGPLLGGLARACLGASHGSVLVQVDMDNAIVAVAVYAGNLGPPAQELGHGLHIRLDFEIDRLAGEVELVAHASGAVIVGVEAVRRDDGDGPEFRRELVQHGFQSLGQALHRGVAAG